MEYDNITLIWYFVIAKSYIVKHVFTFQSYLKLEFRLCILLCGSPFV